MLDDAGSVLGGTSLTLEFLDEGRLGGSAGCNRFNARLTQSKQDVQVIRPATTRRLCSTPAGTMEQEQALLAAFQSATRVRLDGDRLELRGTQAYAGSDSALTEAAAPRRQPAAPYMPEPCQ